MSSKIIYINFNELNKKIKLSSSVQHMLSLTDRIRFFPDFFDFPEGKEKGYFIEDKHLYFTYLYPTICHEIAHMVEMNYDRLLLQDWGIKMGITRKASSFFAMLSRETRVRAIQCHIDPHTLLFQQNPCVTGEINNFLPFRKFKNKNEVIDWMTNIEDQTFDKWSEERVVHEWTIKLEYVLNKIDSTPSVSLSA